MEVKYAIQHSFKKEVIIPIAALYNNFDFFYNTKEEFKLVKTSDGYICEVKRYKLVHICQLENKINEIYHIDTWSYIKRWYNAIPQMDSMMFIVMELRKNGE